MILPRGCRSLAGHPHHRRDDIECAGPLIRATLRHRAAGAAPIQSNFGRAPRNAYANRSTDDGHLAVLTEGCYTNADGFADRVVDGMEENTFFAGLRLAGSDTNDSLAIYSFFLGDCHVECWRISTQAFYPRTNIIRNRIGEE